MRKKFDVQETKTKLQVEKAYEEYKKFMKVSSMPSYKFKYTIQESTTIAEERYENGSYYLIVANTLCSNAYRSIAKGILFHELTHILDEEELSRMYGFSHDDRNTPYVYKEIHAEQIRTLYLLGCETIEDLKGIDKEKVSFYSGKNLYNIHDYLIESQKELRENIKWIELTKQRKAKINMQEFNNVLNRIFYYIGTASIYLKYCDTSAYEELDIKDVWNYYGYNINLLLKEFISNSLGFHTKELIEAMGKIRALIFIEYDKLKIIDYSR